jgi:hypothetical protein
MYTTRVAKLLWDNLKKNDINNLPNIKEKFSKIENLSLNSVREICMEMLTILSNTNDSLVENICSIVTQIDEKSGDGILIKSVDFNNIGTKQSFRYMNMNLIVDTNPIEFARNNFKLLLDKISDQGCTTAKKLYSNYEKEKSNVAKKISRVDERVTNEIQKLQQQEEIKNNKVPIIEFPDCCQINTMTHINEFSKNNKKYINPKEIRNNMALESIPFNDCHVADWIMLLLYSGVGIYSPNNEYLNDTYNSTVLDMASAGSLAYLISDASICYGTNYPIYRVFITKEFADNISINTLFQLLGRTGRVDQSWSAEAFIDKTTALGLIEYINNPNCESSNVEANNMQKTFISILEKHQPIKQIECKIDTHKKGKIIIESMPDYVDSAPPPPPKTEQKNNDNYKNKYNDHNEKYSRNNRYEKNYEKNYERKYVKDTTKDNIKDNIKDNTNGNGWHTVTNDKKIKKQQEQGAYVLPHLRK